MKEDDKEVFIMFTLIILCNFGGCVPLIGLIFREYFPVYCTSESRGFRALEKLHSVTAGL